MHIAADLNDMLQTWCGASLCIKVSMQAPDIVCCRKHMLEFMHKAAKVTDDIMTCFAIGLGLPEDFYKKASRLLLLTSVR